MFKKDLFSDILAVFGGRPREDVKEKNEEATKS
jgi:hypothetical protein